jgi:hypothetical protein
VTVCASRYAAAAAAAAAVCASPLLLLLTPVHGRLQSRRRSSQHIDNPEQFFQVAVEFLADALSGRAVT